MPTLALGSPEMNLETQPANREIVQIYGETIRTRTREFIQCEIADIRANRRRGAAEVSIKFTVTPEGQVTTAKSVVNFGGTPGLERCLIANLRQIRFPPPGENPVFVTYPFRFNRTTTNPAPTPRRTVVARKAPPPPKKKKNASKLAQKKKKTTVAKKSARRKPSSLPKRPPPKVTRKPATVIPKNSSTLRAQKSKPVPPIPRKTARE